ncbi:hypothetical protein AcV7_000098 [Taiwanofungus camphoratus]|nr:hypothetical protein AcV7_000098 [Antrodia cinnamomea]
MKIEPPQKIRWCKQCDQRLSAVRYKSLERVSSSPPPPSAQALPRQPSNIGLTPAWRHRRSSRMTRPRVPVPRPSSTRDSRTAAAVVLDQEQKWIPFLALEKNVSGCADEVEGSRIGLGRACPPFHIRAGPFKLTQPIERLGVPSAHLDADAGRLSPAAAHVGTERALRVRHSKGARNPITTLSAITSRASSHAEGGGASELHISV